MLSLRAVAFCRGGDYSPVYAGHSPVGRISRAIQRRLGPRELCRLSAAIWISSLQAVTCTHCHKLTVVHRYPFPDSPDFDPTEVAEIKCAHCGRIFRLLSSLLRVYADSPELHPPASRFYIFFGKTNSSKSVGMCKQRSPNRWHWVCVQLNGRRACRSALPANA
jgi:hypothetical protein